MTTATAERHPHGLGALGWLILLGLASAVLMALGAGMAGDVTVSPHAEERHGTNVWDAKAYLDTGGPFQRDPCRDGKEMWTWRMNGEQWVAIVRGTTIITMFETTPEYIRSVKQRDGCGGGWQLGSHDWPSMAAGQ